MSVLRLHKILKRYRGPLRADFKREYGLWLDDVTNPNHPDYLRPAVTLDLIDGLSPTAAYWRAVNPDVLWGISEQLLAGIADELRGLVYGLAGAEGAPPPRIPRPGVTNSPEPGEQEVIGASEGFDTIEDFEAWYQTRPGARKPN
nr:MAG TPA: protein of unknown function (DUF5361) [Caudoviricetes sp.]